MGFSLARKSGQEAAAYRGGYLRSPAWLRFKSSYYRAIRAAGKIPACQCCFATEKGPEPLDLHHLDYSKVSRRADGTWVSGETPADVVILCRQCHSRLHKILDDFRRDYRGWSRRTATMRVIQQIRAGLAEERNRA